MTEESNQNSTLSLTADIVGAYVSKNPLPASSLTGLISQIHQSLSTLSSGQAVEAASPLVPAVPIKKSVTPDYIISLEDGRKFKSMKRYLTLRNMTPDEYRTKWGLPKDYPIVAPNYAIQRSELAKKFGLGRKAVAPAPTKPKRNVAAKAR
jgi:MucR family transcriptional regulator, transcriptional regulator of exopolysaccharide biosynthesis